MNRWLVAPLAAAALSLAACGPPPAAVVPQGNFGAIAYSQSTGNAGSSYNWLDRARAEQEAVINCGAADCAAVCWIDRQCAALAVGDDITHWGFGLGAQRNHAELHALQQCSTLDGNCHIVRWVCSN